MKMSACRRKRGGNRRALQRAATAGCLTPVEEPSPDAEVPCEGKPWHETRAPVRGLWRRSGAHALARACGARNGPAERAADRGGARHL